MNQENNENDIEINKVIPSSGFDFSLQEFRNTLDKAKALLDSESKLESSREKLLVQELWEDTKKTQLKKLKAKLEAILFLSDRPRAAESLAKEAHADVDEVRLMLSELVQEYEEREGGVIIDCSAGYCMQIADEFENLTENILPIELRTAVLRTLSTIALKEPILQKDLVQIRGGGVYEHVKELTEMGLVKKTREATSHVLHTTKFFTENFKLSQNGIELQKVLKKASPNEVEFVRPQILAQEEDTESENAK